MSDRLVTLGNVVKISSSKCLEANYPCADGNIMVHVAENFKSQINLTLQQ
jgi:hypothetical protein